jgi:Formate/nitrite transporter
VGATAVTIAVAHVSDGFLPAFVLGIFGNTLVCLAVWLCVSARTTTDTMLAIIPPVTAFVAAVYWFISLRARSDNPVVRAWRHLARSRAEADRAAHDPGETP